jgi:KilA-N domain
LQQLLLFYMKTEQIITRRLFNHPIRQKHLTQAFCASDIVTAGNIIKTARGEKPFDLTNYMRQLGVKGFIQEIEKKHGWAKYSTRGRTGAVWVHPILFIDIAFAIDPKLKLEAYEWLFDNLCEFRNNSGDSYKKMCGCLYVRWGNKQTFHAHIQEVAKLIKDRCQVEDWNKADTRQLKLRDQIQEDVSWLAEELRDGEKAVELALRRSRLN